MAEAILRHRAAEMGIEIEVDSAGTGAWHAGEAADPRTLRTLRANGIAHHGRARQLKTADFTDFDLILTMDTQNLHDTLAWPGADTSRVRRFLDRDVPDPYYDHDRGFESVFEMLDEGCRNLLAKSVQQNLDIE